MKEIKLETLQEIEKEYLSEKSSAIARHALSNSDIQAVAASKDTVREMVIDTILTRRNTINFNFRCLFG